MEKYYYAIETFNVVISLEPENFDAYHYLAILIQKGSFKETKPHLHSSILKLLQKPNLVNPNSISRGIISLIKTDPTIKDLLLLKDNSNIDDHTIKIITNWNLPFGIVSEYEAFIAPKIFLSFIERLFTYRY